MTTKASQIKNYKILEAFVQCDYLDGFKYIDNAGEIVNLFVRKNKEVPNFTMGLQGLKINDVDDHIKELKISSNTIWIHFVDPKNLGDIESEANKVIGDILKIIKPTLIRRVGWRTYFAREAVQNKSSPSKDLKISPDINDYDLDNVVLRRKMNDYDVRLEIAPITQLDNPTESALLFDVDLSMGDEDFSLVANNVISDIRNVLKSDELLDTFEELLNND